MTTYTKLKNGEWGIRGEEITKGMEGCSVEVRKKDGSTKKEVIEKVVWRGNGVGIAAIVQRPIPNRPTGKCKECGKPTWEGRKQCRDCWQAEVDWLEDNDEFRVAQAMEDEGY